MYPEFTYESVLAYVQKTFADSFDKILDCDLMEDCGQNIAIVTVESRGILLRADVWQCGESGQLYGEL